jgi:hypothetical protein
MHVRRGMQPVAPLSGEQILVQRTIWHDSLFGIFKGHTETAMPLREGADIDARTIRLHSLHGMFTGSH